MTTIDTLQEFYNKANIIEACHFLLKNYFGFTYDAGSPSRTLPISKYLEPSFLLKNDVLCQKCPTFGYLGSANQDSLSKGNPETSDIEDIQNKKAASHYDGMWFFCIEPIDKLNKTEIAQLTRAFSKGTDIPVVLFIRQNEYLSIATCERSSYIKSGHEFDGDKVGRRVSILRNINCKNPHRGHIEILNSLNVSDCITFDAVYNKWLESLSNELLTKRFYSELSDWYAWAVSTTRFPNNLDTTKDDTALNNESCIRLITRLIFVWFLKRKNLIPEEFFDLVYIRENFIDEFSPYEGKNLMYNPNDGKYYRLILQNLFFAMLNCPIVAEGKDIANNRRFSTNGDDREGSTFMRYKKEFKEGGAKKFLYLANNNVPFLNGGLFDCLDRPAKRLYYDGFSECTESLSQLFVPDTLFFGGEKGIDLSGWYKDEKKKKTTVQGIIDILNRYTFTIEENTPLDQEVSLDPELLGKVFENLLAAVDPVTNESAREKTGSFYTPREVVQYMVDESIVAYLKRLCGDCHEPLYRKLVSYTSDDISISQDLGKTILEAIYNCRVLDPACGSGAFPVGMLQQMVHVLKRVDPSNEMWNDMMIDIAVKETKKELKKAAGNEQERKRIRDNHEVRLKDIEDAFNRDINDPDYARKLYIIERCIFGVDILPIATQISKLRFFISLVVDQRRTNNPTKNFGIRPLPNLEANFVTANTLIPLDCTRDLFTSSESIRYYEETLKELNHKIFLAKRNRDKEELREMMISTRMMMAQALENIGAIGNDGYKQLIDWNPFDQNASAPFFDPEWMFGIKGGFDIYIGNPPYSGISDNNGAFIKNLIEDYKFEPGTNQSLKERKLWLQDDYVKFIRMMENYISTEPHGILAFINNSSFIDNPTFRGMRWHLLHSFNDITILDLHGNARKNNVKSEKGKDENVFNIMQGVSINFFVKNAYFKNGNIGSLHHSELIGPRKEKLARISNATIYGIDYQDVTPTSPFYLFFPQNRAGIDIYEQGFSIPTLMPTCVTGVVTARDGLVIDIDRNALLDKITYFSDSAKSDSEVREHFFGNKKSPKYLPGDSRGWKLSTARQKIKNNDHEKLIIPMAFRVFDNRYIYYTPDMVDWGREEIYSNVINKDNICLVVPRQTTKDWRHVFVSDKVANFNFLATGGQNGAGTHFPLYIFSKTGVRTPNINKTIWEKINVCAEGECTPENIFDYVYGVLHSTAYRESYMQFLKGDFPKIPYPIDKENFCRYSIIGNKLRNLHLFKDIPDMFAFGDLVGIGNNTIEKITYLDSKVYINKSQYFDNIPENVWNFKVGDDQPAQRWLKERKNYILTADDVHYYSSVVYVLNETYRLMKEL